MKLIQQKYLLKRYGKVNLLLALRLLYSLTAKKKKRKKLLQKMNGSIHSLIYRSIQQTLKRSNIPSKNHLKAMKQKFLEIKKTALQSQIHVQEKLKYQIGRASCREREESTE